MVNESQSVTEPKVCAQHQQSGTDNLIAIWSHEDSLEPVIQVWNNAITLS